jgi:hypothetical protein
MLNLNLNTTLSGQGGNPSLGPDPASITYYYTSSVWDDANEVEQRLVITISGSQEVSRQPWNRQFVASGSEEQSRTYPAQSGSSVNVKAIAETPFNPDPETYIAFDYILVGGGSSGGGTGGSPGDCTLGGIGGRGGLIYTGSLQLAYGYSAVTVSLTIPEIGYNSTTNFTASLIDTTFIAEGNESYTISGSINVVQFTDYYSSASLIGTGGLTTDGGPADGQNSLVFGTNLGNQSMTSSISSELGVRYAEVVGTPPNCNNVGRTNGVNGYTWLNGVIYGSSGGGGATRVSLSVLPGSSGGANAGAGGADAPANFGGGGGGFSAGTAAIPQSGPGRGGSGVYIIRYYDPNDEYTATGGVKTKIGDFYYHQFNTAGVFRFTIPTLNPYL